MIDRAHELRTRFLAETPSQREALDKALALLVRAESDPDLPDRKLRVERTRRLVRRCLDALVTAVLFDFARMARDAPRGDREFWRPVEARALTLCLIGRRADDEADQYEEWVDPHDPDEDPLPEEMPCRACAPKPSKKRFRGRPKAKGKPAKPCHLCGGTRVFRAREHYQARVVELREQADRERESWIDRAWANAEAFNVSKAGRATAVVADVLGG